MPPKNYNFELQNRLLAKEVIQRSNASKVCLFLFDQKQTNKPISFLYNSGIATNVTHSYTHHLYQHDPLLPQPPSTNRKDKKDVDQCHKIKFSQPETQLHTNEQYWDALGKAGFTETAARLYSISNSMYIVAGLLKEKGEGHITIDAALSSIDNWLQESHNYISETAIRSFYSSNNSPLITPQPSLFDKITRRELQIIDELQQGKSNKQIGTSLTISEYTVENHLRRIYKKVNVHSRTSLLAKINNHKP